MKETKKKNTAANATSERVEFPRKCTVIDLLQGKAQQKDLDSMMMLALYYIFGIGVEKSKKTAAELLEKAYPIAEEEDALLTNEDYINRLEEGRREVFRHFEITNIASNFIEQTVRFADNLPSLQEAFFEIVGEDEYEDIEDFLDNEIVLPDYDEDNRTSKLYKALENGLSEDDKDDLKLVDLCEIVAKKPQPENTLVCACEKYYQDILMQSTAPFFLCRIPSKEGDKGNQIRIFVLRKLKKYAKIERYQMNGEALTMAEWAQKSGIAEDELKARIEKGLPTAEVLRK